MTNVRQAEIAATTEDHQHALQLQNEANQLASWAERVFAAREEFNGTMTVDPNLAERPGAGQNPELRPVSECYDRQRHPCRRPSCH